MQNRSDLYKKMMRSDRRDVTNAVIYIGAINQDAQTGATVNGSFWKYADLQSPLETDEEVSNRYFTWEERANKLDGSMFFLPENQEETVYNNGIVTEALCTDEAHPEVLFLFNTEKLDIKGLTITFGESYPETFTIVTNNSTNEYTTDSREFVTEDVFNKVDYIKIVPGAMSNGITRFHIEQILFGIGITFTGSKKIISLSIKEKTHPISLELPTVDVSFTVDNQDRYFNANADDSVINFLRKGQPVKAYFYQTLEDGSIEKVNAAYAAMDTTWKDKTSTAEFSATDRLYQMDGTYEDGIYRKDGITAFDQLVDIFDQAGLSREEYSIDPYLKTIILHNPLPKDTYANCILLIANSCRCIMKQDRNFKIIIKASFIPELSTFANAEADYSNAEKLLDTIDVTEYFDWQQSFNRIDGCLFFPPEGQDEYNYSGYISKALSDENGAFEENPVITLTASAAFTFYQLTVQFGNVYPVKAIVRCYNSGEQTESFVSEVSTQKHIINHSFMDVDQVQIEFTKAAAFNRIHIKSLSVDETTDFTFERNDFLEEPSTERQDAVKDVIAVRTVYTLPSTQEDVFSDTTIISADNTLLKMEFNDASIPISVTTMVPATDEEGSEDVLVDYGAEIVKYSNWYCIVRFNNPPAVPTEVTLSVHGFIYKVSNPIYTLNVNTTGTTPEPLENPLIDTVEMAAMYTEWCAKYYSAKAEYSASKVIGDPVLESNDLAFFESEDGSLQLIRVHTVNIKFNGTYNDSSCNGRSTG
ncbi:MAG: hypothetical protein PHY47_15960 [Lachnospiraceae bacterium]|nr:hypothetical protein [Lachnospiraceae bacterium]